MQLNFKFGWWAINFASSSPALFYLNLYPSCKDAQFKKLFIAFYEFKWLISKKSRNLGDKYASANDVS